jgi:Spy/CpxP family protein refolding chaperone
LLVAVTVAFATGSAMAQRQQPGQGGRGGANLMGQVLTNADLQKELKVTDEQKGKFKDVAAKQAEVTKKMRDLFTGGGAPDRAKMTELRTETTKVQEEVKKVTEDTLTSEQKKRIKQIEIQAMGLRAFSNEEVVKELKITDEQKTKIKEVVDANQKELRDAGLGFGRPMGGQQPDAEKLAADRKKRAEMTEKAMEKVSATLTEEQKKTWTEMTGPKFDTSKLTAGAGFGGRPMNN